MSSIGSAFSIAAGGLNSATNQLTNTSRKIADFGTDNPGSDDLAANVVDLSTEKTAFKANALVLKTANQMLGTLLDVLDTDPR